MKQPKSERIVIRLSPDDRQRVANEADREGLDLSSYVRMTLKRALAARQT
jgi:predicted DNA binding CopG/RHH family protein